MENKKIKNATKKVYDGIEFKSLLEVTTYKVLKENGFEPKYEEKQFLIWESFIPHIPLYTKNSFKKKNKNIQVISNKTVLDNRPLLGIAYKPDFIFEYKNKVIIIETKGFVNDVFPYKFKMFRKYLETLPNSDKYIIWEIFTKQQLLECIKLLKDEEV